MQLRLFENLPFTSLTIRYQNKQVDIENVLVDTGSASIILATDAVSIVGISPLPDDTLYTIRGVGGVEVVYIRMLDKLQVGDFVLSNFEVEIGGMDYGFAINGILGMDFLLEAGATINLKEMRLDFES